MKYLLLLIIISVIVFPQSKDSLSITYIGNEGFLISGKTKRILIDGIFTQGWSKYHTPSQQTLEKERNAIHLFDSLDVLLVSHNHEDHINPGYLAEHMVNNKKSVLICPVQANDLLKPLDDYETFRHRINVIAPKNYIIIDTVIQNINFKIIPLPHADDNEKNIQNIGFVFRIAGFNIFHPGDASTNNLADYTKYNLSEDSVDIAFLPEWFFDTEYGDKGRDIIKYIKPKAIIIMHLNTHKITHYKNAVNNITDIPPVHFMLSQMEILTFADSLFVTSAGQE